jgi:lipopolysaccharide assembly protein B
MEQAPFAILFGLFILVIFVFYIYNLRPKQNGKRKEAQTEYIAGLNHMIAGENIKALERLRATIHLDTEYVDAYVKIGDILRNVGRANRSIKIHSDLFIRQNINSAQRVSILKSLALDYHANGQNMDALKTIEQILDIDRHHAWAQNFQITLFEDLGEWEEAINQMRKNEQVSKEERANRLAGYKVEQGKKLALAGREHQGRLCYREAMKLNRECAAAYLELADSYVRENRLDDAVTALQRLIHVKPEFAELAFIRLKELFYNLGHFEEMEKVYLELLKTNPHVVEAYLGMVEIYEKKGELRRAIDACEKVLSLAPKRLDGKLMLMSLNGKLGKANRVLEISQEIVDELLTRQTKYRCQICTNSSQDYFLRCPKCKAWNSAKKE